MPNLRVREGDIISIPLGGAGTYLAHIVRKLRSGMFIAAAYAPPSDGGVDIVGRPTLVAVTFDSLLRTGDWSIVGRKAPDPQVPIPVHKVNISSEDGMFIQDVGGEILRRATDEEILHLSTPVTYSPAAFQKAIAQVLGDDPWESRFDPMIPNWTYCEQTMITGTAAG